MSDVTQILQQIESGDRAASEQLLPLVYDELRKLAAARMVQESPDHTLQATALVHEAYLRLVDADQAARWDNRRHFFAAAAEAMRRILVESARSRQQLKHGGDRQREPLIDAVLATDRHAEQLLVVNDAIDRLAEEDPEAAQLVKLRYFVGLSVEDAAASIGIPRSTAYKHWAYAKAWLQHQIGPVGNDA